VPRPHGSAARGPYPSLPVSHDIYYAFTLHYTAVVDPVSPTRGPPIICMVHRHFTPPPLSPGPAVQLDIMTASTGFTFELVGGVQTGNIVRKSGGASAFMNYGDLAEDTVVSVRDVVFVNNTGLSSGGGLVITMNCVAVGDASLTVSGCVFEGNHASVNGGGVWTNFNPDPPTMGSGGNDPTALFSCPTTPYRCAVARMCAGLRVCLRWVGGRTYVRVS
jgi:hypothetical protein